MHPVAFDLHRAYRLNPAATLRPELFGALAYHFGNRRLSFLKSRQLVTVVRLAPVFVPLGQIAARAAT